MSRQPNMIGIRNTQRSMPIDKKKVQHEVQAILDFLQYPDFDIGIWFCSAATIKKYNREFRHKDKATDVLSFANYPELKAGKRIRAHTPDDKNLGDIMLCPSYIEADAPKWQRTFEQRITELLVHGICHLLGYDHITDAQFRVMRRKELAILRHLSIQLRY